MPTRKNIKEFAKLLTKTVNSAVVKSIGFAAVLLCQSSSAYALFSQCPAFGLSPGCAVLITINPNGSLSFQTDPSVPPYDGVEDTLVGIVNNSGATVFGVSLTGNDIFGFDGDGVSGGNYAGPDTSITSLDNNHGTINFTSGLCSSGSADPNCTNQPNYLWFSLEGAPSQIKLASSVTIDPGHGTNCPPPPVPVGKEKFGAIGLTDYPATNPPSGKLKEDILAAAIAVNLQAQLTNAGYTVAMTKTDSASCPTFRERTSIANNERSNMFVSIHLNAPLVKLGIPIPCIGSVTGCGTSVLYDPDKTSAKTLAQFTVDQIAYNLGVNNRGIDPRSGYAVLRGTTSRMTAIIAEVARLSSTDEDVMHNPASIGNAANGIFSGIDAFVNQ